MDAPKPEAEDLAAVPAALPATEHKAPLALRTVAIFEGVKGFLVLLVALVLVSLVHRDVAMVIQEVVRELHINPDHHYIEDVLKVANGLNDNKLWGWALLALMYAVVRFVETYGLWHERPWAEWFAVISAGLYVPFEVAHLVKEPSHLSRWTILIFNLAIVAYMGYLLAHNPRKPGCRRRERTIPAVCARQSPPPAALPPTRPCAANIWPRSRW